MVYLAGATYLLKIAMYCGVTGLTVTLLTDKDIHKVFGSVRRLIRKMNGLKAIPLGDEHTSVLGLTRHGKTYALKKTLSQAKEGVFFFNTQLEEMPKNFIEASGANAFEQIDSLLRQGKKINYLPSTDKDKRQTELKVIIRSLYDGQKRNIRFVIDEAHLFKKDALSMAQEIATTGLRFGIKGVFISQRGALMDNTLISQSNRYIFFAMNPHDSDYFKNYGFPIEEVQSRIKGEKYLFCVYDNKTVTGSYKIV
jgi:hypothetical protein